MNINFYKNNNLVLTQKEIEILEDNFSKNSCWEDFPVSVLNILNKSIPVTDYYKKQFLSNTGLQSGKIFEIVVGETLSKIFNTSYVSENVFENEEYSIILTGEKVLEKFQIFRFLIKNLIMFILVK